MLPKHIKKKLVSASLHAKKVQEIMEYVNEWLESRGYDPDELRSGNGISLEEFEYGNCPLEEFEEYFDTLVPLEQIKSPDGAEVYSSAHFADLVEDGCITDCDGGGYYSEDGIDFALERKTKKSIPVDMYDPDAIRGSVYPYILWYAR